MLNRNKSFLISSLICISLIAIVTVPQSFAASGKPAIGSVVSKPDANQLMLPYDAMVTGNDVLVRSGPGTNYYVTSKLKANDLLRIIAEKSAWCCITPPAGSFSWIAKQYVKLDAAAGEGTVISDNVNVRAGNADGIALHSSTVQGTLNKGDKVKITGEEQSDYLKIVPPPFAYVWVSKEYLKPMGPSKETVKIPGVTTDTNSTEVKYLQQYYTLEKLVDTEAAKPQSAQNYVTVKSALEQLSKNPNAGKAARYAQYSLKRIESLETAIRVSKELAVQDQQMSQAKTNIAKAAQARTAEIANLGRFAVIGKFRASAIYGKETRYQILDSSGKIICYAIPEGAAADMDLSKFIDKNAGLVGTIEPNPATSTALVRFTEIGEVTQ